MDPDRKGLVAAGLAGLFAICLVGALAATGAWRNALFLGAADAATAAAGPGFFDLLFNAFIPDKLAEAGTAAALMEPQKIEGGAAAPTPEEAAAALAAAQQALAAAQRLANCTGADCAEEAAAAMQKAASEAVSSQSPDDGTDAAESEDERLKMIKMKERSAGESRMYGNGSSTARPGKVTPAEIEASMGGMIQRLKSRAGKDGSASLGSGGRDGPAGGAAEASSGGDDDPIMTRENQSDKLNSPTLRALQKLNKDSRHSVGMSRDQGTTDGSRDKAGKSFDGNKATFGAIPITETTGAMGRKQIKALDETAPPDLKGQPVR